ncbi:MAG TPA: lasso peptide biosynthesis B2 protein [Candidatus Acidoferrales bacterium]|jgi:hypothetical protein|nr:lasso peptide biosynthesis B2 protein [Candidatus Acidoferrales bacterium]
MSPQTLRSFLRLDQKQKRSVLVAAMILVATRVGLRLFGFRAWRKFLGSFGERLVTERVCEASFGRVLAIAKMQSSAERHLFFRPSCLEHSLALQWMLRRENIAAVMKIGARKQGGRFEAHAWVEVNGTPLDNGGAGGTEFLPFEEAYSSLETEIP